MFEERMNRPQTDACSVRLHLKIDLAAPQRRVFVLSFARLEAGRAGER